MNKSNPRFEETPGMRTGGPVVDEMAEWYLMLPIANSALHMGIP